MTCYYCGATDDTWSTDGRPAIATVRIMSTIGRGRAWQTICARCGFHGPERGSESESIEAFMQPQWEKEERQ